MSTSLYPAGYNTGKVLRVHSKVSINLTSGILKVKLVRWKTTNRHHQKRGRYWVSASCGTVAALSPVFWSPWWRKQAQNRCEAIGTWLQLDEAGWNVTGRGVVSQPHWLFLSLLEVDVNQYRRVQIMCSESSWVRLSEGLKSKYEDILRLK